MVLREGGVQLRLRVVDTPGFGDAVDNSNCWEPVTQFVETQYEAFLDAETRVNRVQLPDSRVHACLYFIAPSGHGLKPLDVEYMQRLHDKVNIIPVIAKSDTMTPEEIAHFKTQILTQISAAKIRIYEFPDFEEAEEAERKERRENGGGERGRGGDGCFKCGKSGHFSRECPEAGGLGFGGGGGGGGRGGRRGGRPKW